jgi:hypothetical protein
MNKFLTLLVLGAVLAVARVVLVGLAVALVLVLAYSFITRPGQTLVFLGAITLLSVASAEPLAFVIALGVVGVVVVMVAGARAT